VAIGGGVWVAAGDQSTYYIDRIGSAWSCEGGAREGVDYGSSSLGEGQGFAMYATDTLASGAQLLSWVEDVISSSGNALLFLRPSMTDTSSVVLYGYGGSEGPALRVISPYEQP